MAARAVDQGDPAVRVFAADDVVGLAVADQVFFSGRGGVGDFIIGHRHGLAALIADQYLGNIGIGPVAGGDGGKTPDQIRLPAGAKRRAVPTDGGHGILLAGKKAVSLFGQLHAADAAARGVSDGQGTGPGRKPSRLAGNILAAGSESVFGQGHLFFPAPCQEENLLHRGGKDDFITSILRRPMFQDQRRFGNLRQGKGQGAVRDVHSHIARGLSGERKEKRRQQQHDHPNRLASGQRRYPPFPIKIHFHYKRSPGDCQR